MSQRTSTPTWLQSFRKKLSVEQRPISARARRNLFISAAILIVVGLSSFITIFVQVVNKTGIELADHRIESWFDHIRNIDATVVLVTLSEALGPIGLPIIVLVVTIVWLIRAKHAWRPLLLAGFMLLGLVIVQITTRIVQRHRPPLHYMLLGPDHTFSFPSGHVFGTADFLLFMAYLLISRRPTKGRIIGGLVIVIVGIVLQMFGRVYLGYHWMSDTLSAACFSVALLGIMIAVDTWKTTRVGHATPASQSGDVR